MFDNEEKKIEKAQKLGFFARLLAGLTKTIAEVAHVDSNTES